MISWECLGHGLFQPLRLTLSAKGELKIRIIRSKVKHILQGGRNII
jgi:hypothetical protein